MAQITNFPRGLVSLTGLRDMGENPSELLKTIAPGIDITQFLLLNREVIDGAGVFVAAQGALNLGTAFDVPAGELWYIHEFSVLIDCNAGSTVTLYPCYAESATVVSAIGDPRVVPASTRGFVRDNDDFRWAVPGSRLLCYVGAFTGAPSVAGNAIISRFRI